MIKVSKQLMMQLLNTLKEKEDAKTANLKSLSTASELLSVKGLQLSLPGDYVQKLSDIGIVYSVTLDNSKDATIEKQDAAKLGIFSAYYDGIATTLN